MTQETIEYGEHTWKLIETIKYNNPFPKGSIGYKEGNLNTYDKLVIYKNILKNGSIGKLTLYIEKTIANGIKYQVHRGN